MTTITVEERIAALEDELAGARFAAESHLKTVNLQKAIIARMTSEQPILSAVVASDERLTIDQARELLIGFMNEHFTDRTFHRYIRADTVDRNRLAGDFAWQMATALRKIGAAPCAMCHGTGSVGRAPDDYYDCPDCTGRAALASAPVQGAGVASVRELLDALDDMDKLRAEIRSKGMPPHTDYWHQSIYMREERISKARAALASAQPVAAIPEAGQSVPTCAWTLDERDESSVWDSACGEKWIFNDGGPKENDVRYCHGCGKPVLATMSADAQSKGGA